MKNEIALKKLIIVFGIVLAVGLSVFCGCQRQSTVSYDEAVNMAEKYLTENKYELKKEVKDYQYGEQTIITASKGEHKYSITFYSDTNNETSIAYETETINLYKDAQSVYSKIDYVFFENLAKVLKDKDTNAKEIKKAVENKKDYYDNGHPEGPDTEGYKMVKIYGQNFGNMRVLYYLQGNDIYNVERVIVQGVCG
ncbi:MAG: hypothetical protein E7515_04565 [Ruminococcaceae bacterium]|nr:hypothetical protein [Oscillospiraceae bacterium]